MRKVKSYNAEGKIEGKMAPCDKLVKKQTKKTFNRLKQEANSSKVWGYDFQRG